MQIIPRLAYPINNQLVPTEGPKALPILVDFSIENSRLVDLSNSIYSKNFAGAQSIGWVNKLAEPIYINVDGIGTDIVIPPKSCGIVPFVVAEKFSVSSAVAQSGKYIKITLFNTPMPSHVVGIVSADTSDILFADLVDGAGDMAGHAGDVLRVNAAGSSLVYDRPSYSISATIIGSIGASQILLQHVLAESVIIEAGSSYGSVYARSAAAGDWYGDILCGSDYGTAVTIGTVNLTAGSNHGTINITSAHTLAPGDVIWVVGMSTIVAPLADLSVNLYPRRAA